MQRIIATRSRTAACRGRRRCWLRALPAACLLLWGALAHALDIGEPFEFAPRDPSRVAPAGDLRVRGALALRAHVDGQSVPREISGLAFSPDDAVLYAVTDAGWLLHLVPRIADGRLVGLSLLRRARLADAQGRALRRTAADAEGLAALDAADGTPGNTRLLISFEGRPRLAVHAPDGRQLRPHALRSPLDDVTRFEAPNHGLEALALHPTHGYLVALERPLRGSDAAGVTLYAEDGAQWQYPATDPTIQSLTGLDTLHDGTLLAVERSYAGLFRPVVCTLSKLHLDGATLVTTVLGRYSSAQGWPVDNFEAIAFHRDRHFFVASDDNEHPLQKALLIYFELPPAE